MSDEPPREDRRATDAYCRPPRAGVARDDVPDRLRRRSDRLLDRTLREWALDATDTDAG
jgi:hypothetical protein